MEQIYLFSEQQQTCKTTEDEHGNHLQEAHTILLELSLKRAKAEDKDQNQVQLEALIDQSQIFANACTRKQDSHHSNRAIAARRVNTGASKALILGRFAHQIATQDQSYDQDYVEVDLFATEPDYFVDQDRKKPPTKTTYHHEVTSHTITSWLYNPLSEYVGYHGLKQDLVQSRQTLLFLVC